MIRINEKYGCLTVLDLGEEYSQTEAYKNLMTEKLLYEEQLKNNQLDFFKRLDLERLLSETNQQLETHYKCRCKCGKEHYYNKKTIERKPSYCFYPISISTRYTYSTKAKNATYRKEQEYKDIECVTLLDKSECIPSETFCSYYNSHRIKQLEKVEQQIAKIQRVRAKNYRTDFVGRQYESLYIEECCNEHLESEPSCYFTYDHHKHWDNITVYKQYKCKCVLCGKEHLFTCDQFGIYPPSKNGVHAYDGYWSKAYCDCHKISSFQWIVNKILFENNIRYQVEYSFPDLYGCFHRRKLRFDFAILNEDRSVKCLIECQGEQHYKTVDEFGDKRDFDIQITNDELKRKYAKQHAIPLIEIPYKHKKIEKIEEILKDNEII